MLAEQSRQSGVCDPAGSDSIQPSSGQENHIQLRHLRYFVKIVEAGSFSRAATMIFIAQPALSQQMAELEEELGVVLLHRSARGVRPTAAGDALYREAVSILRQVEKLPEIVRFSGGEVAGSVSLGMSSTLASLFAGGFMKACRTALPMVNLSFVTEDSLSLKSRIAARTLDLAIVFEEAPTPGLVRHPLLRQRLYFVDRKQGVRGGAKSISLSQVAARPLVLPSHPNAMRSLLDEHFAAAGLAPTVVAEANMLHGMLSAVQSGVGATVIPMGDFKAGTGQAGLVATPIEPAIHQTAHVVSSDGVSLTRAGEAVRDMLGPFVHSFLGEQSPLGMECIEG
ncbi:LysR substrate-binding domain-containing protein [Variovorax sp. J22R24]|uniref:LysR substrate-binding domain-containing protein n=1 Tax=Variovorax gracilis TaxID=3053502 RepID=UPI002575DBD2|nr:LysR substrate-binding domain-containing protein [Variovorax sp. J22R24]MDM0104063.1 LysR substrate-binding domain-containing protein [Variovorax sp. J22R24]